MAKLISGKIVSVKVRNEVKKETEELRENHGIVPGLAVILVGNDPASQVYVPATATAPEADADAVSASVAGALRVGYRSFDCAACYGNEDMIGKIFADAFAEGIVKREELFIASKVWNDMHGDGDVLIACAKTLKDLKLDYLDMYYVHWPFPNYHAPHCDVDSRNPDSKPFTVERFMKTWRQMERLVDMGLTKHIGMSNMTIPKLEAVLPLCNNQTAPAAGSMDEAPSRSQLV